MATEMNSALIAVMEELVFYVGLKGENAFKKRAFEKALDSLIAHKKEIQSSADLNGIPNVGKSTITHLSEFLTTGKILYLDELKSDKLVNAYIIFKNVYGLGEVSIKKIVERGITDIDGLRTAFKTDPSILNKKQAIGLKYYEDVLKRIPRSEIDSLNDYILSTNLIPDGMKYEITGSYRRGLSTSGDIDIIVTGEINSFKEMLSRFQSQGIIVERLTDGVVKCLVIGRVPGFETFRRIDFLYSPPTEFAFALLYFTGSKYFNTAMRLRALSLGYSLNEHGFTLLNSGNLDENFQSEKDIFDFLGMKYKSPLERTNGLAVELINGEQQAKQQTQQAKQQTQQAKQQAKQQTQLPKVIVAKVPKKVQKVPKKVQKVPKKVPKQVQKVQKVAGGVGALINDFVQQGVLYLDTLTKEQIAGMLLHANDMYFNHEPVIDDDQYDVLNDYIAEKYPDYEMPIGADAGEGKVALPYKMPSMNKFKTQKLIDNWFAKYPGIAGKSDNYIITSKMDGVSGLFYNENGYTR